MATLVALRSTPPDPPGMTGPIVSETHVNPVASPYWPRQHCVAGRVLHLLERPSQKPGFLTISIARDERRCTQ